jgi:hypothetical protein
MFLTRHYNQHIIPPSDVRVLLPPDCTVRFSHTICRSKTVFLFNARLSSELKLDVSMGNIQHNGEMLLRNIPYVCIATFIVFEDDKSSGT